MNKPTDTLLDDLDAAPQILFEPFQQWQEGAENNVNGNRALALAKYARAVADGVALVFEVNERDSIEDHVQAPQYLFDEYQRGRLNLMAWAACSMLSEQAARFIDRVNHA